MTVLIIAAAEATDQQLHALESVCAAQGGDTACHRLVEPIEYGDLLDVVLDAQPSAVLIAGAGDDAAVVRGIVDVVWKFDDGCLIGVDTGHSRVEGVLGADDGVERLVATMLADGRGTGWAPDLAAQAPSPTTATDGVAGASRVGAALLRSAGWATVEASILDAEVRREIEAAARSDEDDGLLYDEDGCRHWVAVGRRAPRLLRALEDDRLAHVVEEAVGDADVWLGALELLGPSGAPGWRRDSAAALSATAGSSFRPSLSVLLGLGNDFTVEIATGSHRLDSDRAPAVIETVIAGRTRMLLITAGCRRRIVSGRAVHLRFIRGWMKPDVLLVDALREQLGQMGPRGRRWCGEDVGLPASVAEFIAVEEAAASGVMSQRKGSGV
jgi:hypothetical protein